MGRCIAVRIFLAMSSVLMSAIKRSGAWQLEHTISIAKVLRRSSAHGTYVDLPAGLAESVGGSGGETGAGTTWLRVALARPVDRFSLRGVGRGMGLHWPAPARSPSCWRLAW